MFYFDDIAQEDALINGPQREGTLTVFPLVRALVIKIFDHKRKQVEADSGRE